ncbi:MAG: type II secretion system F family protein [Actinomycetota bacterium]|nr:type II secretion system F family protein [Actinomycetota bacterium]
MRRALATLFALAAVVPGVSAAAEPRLSVDTSAYPAVRATVVTPVPVARVPKLTENGASVVGLDAVNLGSRKSVVLVVDRSQSMLGPALADATDAASAFVRSKSRGDRVAVVAVGSSAVQLTGFTARTADAEAALRSLEVDKVRGTALFDSVILSAQAFAGDAQGARVVVLLTDGQEVSSDASLEQAIAAAREANVAVYPIGIESPSFRPAPLQRLAAKTGGRYAGAAGTASLHRIYAELASELRRTWQLSYLTAARPGERLELTAGGAEASTFVPGAKEQIRGTESSLPEPVFAVGPMLMATLVGLCIFLAAAVLLRAPAGGSLRRRINPHLAVHERKSRRGPVQERFATASTLMRATEGAFGHLKIWHSLHRLLERADVPLRTVELVYAAGGSAVAGGLLAALFGMSSFVTLIAMGVGGSIPILVVWVKAKRRLAAIEDQLPDLLVTLAAALKAGHSFRQGIQAVVDEGQPPASKEFKRVLTETRLGRPMDDALAEMAERVGSKNLRFVVTSVAIQRQVGGSLAGIFDMVAEAVRQRQQFARKIRSLTAMGRASAYVLCGIPFFVLGMLTLMNREYMDPLYHTPTGHKLMIGGLVMMAVGSLFLRKIVSFRG